jgi:hypothetical protein
LKPVLFLGPKSFDQIIILSIILSNIKQTKFVLKFWLELKAQTEAQIWVKISFGI